MFDFLFFPFFFGKLRQILQNFANTQNLESASDVTTLDFNCLRCLKSLKFYI